MPHARETIREYIKLRLIIATTLAGTNVYASRVYPHEKSKLPSLTVYSPLEEIDGDFDTTGGVLRRTLVLVIEARVAGTASSFPEQALDDLCGEVEAMMGGDPTLGSNVAWVRLASTETELDGEQEKVVGLATLTFRVQYETLASDPTVIL